MTILTCLCLFCREKLIQYYSVLSATADRRKERADWKMKRAQLHEKRVEFLKESEQFKVNDGFEETIIDGGELSPSSAIPIKKEESLSSVIPGSGDYVVNSSKVDNIINVCSGSEGRDDVVSQSLELTGGTEEKHVHQKPAVDQTLQSLGPQGILEEVNVEKREWLIALDVAEKARQSAVQFKERDMFNDYNILTGEVKEYSKRFGKNKVVAEENVPEILPQPKEHSSSVKYSENSDLNVKEMSCEDRVENSVVDNIFSNQSTSDIIQVASSNDLQSSTVPCNSLSVTFSQTTSQQGAMESSVKEKSASNVRLETLKESFFSDVDVNIDEIDMTTIYQNLRVSVMKPLLTQLELANEAVLRLMLNKHNLLKHIECIRRYFFLVDGEFGRNLTRSLFSEIQVAVHPSYVLNVSNLNSLLRSSAIGTSMEEEYTERLSFYVKEVPTVFRLIDPETLDCLSMRYKTYWPLNVVITDEAVVKCDRIFTFLMQLQRTSWALEQDIYLLKDRRLVHSQHFRKVGNLFISENLLVVGYKLILNVWCKI